jgi:hypothetical protein
MVWGFQCTKKAPDAEVRVEATAPGLISLFIQGKPCWIYICLQEGVGSCQEDFEGNSHQYQSLVTACNFPVPSVVGSSLLPTSDLGSNKSYTIISFTSLSIRGEIPSSSELTIHIQ